MMHCDVPTARPRSLAVSSRVPARTHAWMEWMGPVGTSPTMTVALDRRVMHEELLGGVLADEPVPLRLVEPLDRAAVLQLRAPPFHSGAVLASVLRGADPPPGTDRLETVPAIDGLARGRLEGNLGRNAARRADSFVKLARGRPRRNRGGAQSSRGPSDALPLLFVTAAPATGRLMLKPSF